jgi:DNA polymerase-3 subunit alpha
VREITTKNGSKMAFIKLEDQTADIELILFPNAFQQTVGLWQRDRIVLVRGKASAKDREGNIGEELKVMVDDAREITAEQATAYQETGRKVKVPGTKKAAASVTAAKTKVATVKAPTAASPRIYVRLPDSKDQQLLLSLKAIIDGHQGDTEVVLVLGNDSDKQIIKLPMRMTAAEAGIAKLRELAGTTNIKIQ